MTKDIEIYKDYLVAKYEKETTITEVAAKHHITRNGLYELVRRIENGNVAKIKQELKDNRYQVYWKYKYEPRYLALPKSRKPWVMAELRKIINDMAEDEFSVSKISELLGKDRSTILHHLDK